VGQLIDLNDSEFSNFVAEPEMPYAAASLSSMRSGEADRPHQARGFIGVPWSSSPARSRMRWT
jgi:hypothetical protein